MGKKHTWKFFRAGGVDQVVLERGSDIANLSELDLKLWIAVAMPVKGIDLDPKTAGFLDRESDGRIRAQDILATVEWLKKVLTDLDDVAAGKPDVDISRIADEKLRTTATRIASEDGGEGKTLTVDQVTKADDVFTKSRFNGDSIITEKTPGDEALQTVVKEIIAALGSIPDRCNEPGIDADKVKTFFTDAEAIRDWFVTGDSKDVERPLGDATPAAADKLRALAPKIADYFARTRLAAFDERVIAASHGSDADLAALTNKDLAPDAPEILRMPLARIAPNQPLPLDGGVNPGFADRMLDLRETVIRPILGASVATLTEADFAKVTAKFASYEAWLAKKPATKLDSLSRARILELLAADHREKLEELIGKDADQKDELDRILDAEKLVYLQRDFMRVLRNFVTFSDFYSKRGSIFQAGTLYLDGRACDLCIEVTDPGKHAILASLASTYLAYCDLKRKDQPNRTIVAAFTAGDSDNLMVGRNGIFVDRDGNDWDATISKIVDNPISIRQAFFSPYKKFVRLVEEQVQKRASDAEAESHARVSDAATQTANADRGPAVVAPVAAAPAAAGGRKIDIGTVAAIGVAVGGIGAMVTGILGAFFGLGKWMPIGILAIVMLISGPSMVLAYLKLRRRNLGPLLDASGWAINGLANVNVPFGGALTEVATLPEGADRILHDPYAEEKSPWRAYLVLAIIAALFVAWTTRSLDRYLPRSVRASTVLHSAPATPRPAAPAAH